MTNPYRPSTAVTPLSSPWGGRIRYLLGVISAFGGLWIAVSGTYRFSNYGGFAVLESMTLSERGIAGLWVLTHLAGILSALLVSVGLFRKRLPNVVLGCVIFTLVCVFAWAWPMDFLWFA